MSLPVYASASYSSYSYTTVCVKICVKNATSTGAICVKKKNYAYYYMCPDATDTGAICVFEQAQRRAWELVPALRQRGQFTTIVSLLL